MSIFYNIIYKARYDKRKSDFPSKNTDMQMEQNVNYLRYGLKHTTLK